MLDIVLLNYIFNDGLHVQDITNVIQINSVYSLQSIFYNLYTLNALTLFLKVIECSVVNCSNNLQVLESAIKVHKIINCSHHNKCSQSVSQYCITTNCYSYVEINPHRHSV